jgi:CrcB protein
MKALFLVALGGALGASLRYMAGVYALRWLPPGWPWATGFVNVSGSLLMGLLAGWFAVNAPSPGLRLLLLTGLLGGFTTFSAFSFEIVEMLRLGEPLKAGLYASLSVFLSLLALFLGLWLARRILA